MIACTICLRSCCPPFFSYAYHQMITHSMCERLFDVISRKVWLMCSQERVQREDKSSACHDVMSCWHVLDMFLLRWSSGLVLPLVPPCMLAEEEWCAPSVWRTFTSGQVDSQQEYHSCEIPSQPSRQQLSINVPPNSGKSSRPAMEGHEPFASQRGGYGCTISLSTRFFRASEQSRNRNISPSQMCLAKNAEVWQSFTLTCRDSDHQMTCLAEIVQPPPTKPGEQAMSAIPLNAIELRPKNCLNFLEKRCTNDSKSELSKAGKLHRNKKLFRVVAQSLSKKRHWSRVQKSKGHPKKSSYLFHMFPTNRLNASKGWSPGVPTPAFQSSARWHGAGPSLKINGYHTEGEKQTAKETKSASFGSMMFDVSFRFFPFVRFLLLNLCSYSVYSKRRFVPLNSSLAKERAVHRRSWGSKSKNNGKGKLHLPWSQLGICGMSM